MTELIDKARAEFARRKLPREKVSRMVAVATQHLTDEAKRADMKEYLYKRTGRVVDDALLDELILATTVAGLEV